MFDDLQKRLSGAFRRFRAAGILTEANIKEGLREVRTALLEADVNYNVVQEFMAAGHRQGGRHAVDQERPARAADRQDRPRRAGRADGAGRPVDPVREGRADGPDALRPPGLGQDDDLRQARAAAGVARAQAAAGRGRPPAPGGRRAAQGHRRAARRAGLQPRPARTRSRSARTPWSRPTARAATRSSSTPPAGCTSTTS